MDSTLKIRDYQGHDVPEPLLSQSVKVWEIEPHRSDGYSHCLVMGWQDSFDAAAGLLEVLADASRYWQSVGKPSKAECAYKCMTCVHDLYARHGHRIPRQAQFGKTYIA